MKIELNNNKYSIYWKYIRKDKNRSNKGDRTECHIVKSLSNTKIASGYAVLSEKDTFSKETGRKTALVRALKETTFSKESKSAIWEEYKNMKGGKW